MAKKKRDTAAGGKAERKLEKARQRLAEAQEMYAQAEARGQRTVEKAQARAAAWLKEAAERVERRTRQFNAAEARTQKKASPSTQPDEAPATEVVAAPEVDAAATILLAPREAAALRALRELGEANGATAQEWRSVAGMSGTTFGRAREALVRYGLVTADSDPGRGTHYALSQDGSLFDLDAVTQQ